MIHITIQISVKNFQYTIVYTISKPALLSLRDMYPTRHCELFNDYWNAKEEDQDSAKNYFLRL